MAWAVRHRSGSSPRSSNWTQRISRIRLCASEGEKRSLSITASRVEEGRGGGRLPVAMAVAFAAAPHSGLPWLRFPSPLIEPDVPISGIRLSDWLHRKAHGGRPM